jgi:Histidine phosphatase superfamily (branch 2)
MASSPSSSSSDQPIALLRITSPGGSISHEEEERETLLPEPADPSSSHSPTIFPRRQLGAVYQMVLFTLVGILIALASGAFAFVFRPQRTQQGDGYIHVPLPRLRDQGMLKYFGGNGPWIGREYEATKCEVSQVHMLSRHGERYPTSRVGVLIERFAQNVSKTKDFGGELTFLNRWDLTEWLDSPQEQLEQETLTGPAAGSARMFTLGTELRSRYAKLWKFGRTEEATVWASDSTRVIHSAKYFSSGFFGINTTVDVQVIPETVERWGDSLTTTYFTRCIADPVHPVRLTCGANTTPRGDSSPPR